MIVLKERVYYQRQYNMKGKKVSSIQSNFQNTITAHTVSNQRYGEKTLLDYESMLKQPMQGGNGRGYQPEIDLSISSLLEKVKKYEIYYLYLMNNEEKKYDQYFQQMVKIIKDEYELGKAYLKKEMDRISECFSHKRRTIEQLHSELSFKYPHERYEKKMEMIANLTVFDVDLIEVNLIDLGNFKHDIRKYLMKQFDMNCSQHSSHKQHSDLINQEYDMPVYPSFIKQQAAVQQKSVETQTDPLVSAVREEEFEDEASNDFLSCDEDIDRKLSASTRRRRKYEVGRQNVIKEEDESEDSMSLLSDQNNQ